MFVMVQLLRDIKNGNKHTKMVEIWGYISMIVVVISMLMKDMKWLRILNSISCAMFIVYGFFIGAYPIILLNSIVISINLWRVYKGES